MPRLVRTIPQQLRRLASHFLWRGVLPVRLRTSLALGSDMLLTERSGVDQAGMEARAQDMGGRHHRLLFWASAFAGIRVGLESYGPGEVALLRFGTASIALFVYASITRMRASHETRPAGDRARRPLRHHGLSRALNFGEQTVTAGAAALIISSVPIFTAILSSMWLHERVGLGMGGHRDLVSGSGAHLVRR